MAAALPGLALILLVVGCANGGHWRRALLRGAVGWGVLLTVSTEALGAVNLLTRPVLLIFWGTVALLAGTWAWHSRPSGGPRRADLHVTELWPLLGVGVIAACTLVIALIAPPNTWDSMTYHMSRVAHWAAAGSVAQYPTNIIRQLWEPPLAEYAVLHLQVLSSGDRGANLVQWFAMLGSLAAVSQIAAQLGAGARGQVIAAVTAATLPMGILQATSTQTDYVCAFWVLCVASFLLEYRLRPDLAGAAWLGAATGLAVLTKGTAYVFLAPAAALFAWWTLERVRWRAWQPALVAAALLLALNLGFFLRGEELYGSPLGPEPERALLVNGSFSPRVLASNLIRDSAIQVGTPSNRLNHLLDAGIARVHSSILHISVSDPMTTWEGTRFEMNALSTDEDYAGDPLQSLLVLIAIVLSLRLARTRPLVSTYAAWGVVAFLLFALYLKWQPWHARLELPLFVASAPLVGVTLEAYLRRPTTAGVCALLLVASLPWLLMNATRPLIGLSGPGRVLPTGETIFSVPRDTLYFAKRPALGTSYRYAVARLGGCKEIELRTGVDDWEYPLWALARPHRVEQIEVTNASSHLADPQFHPCALVTVAGDSVDVKPL